MIDRNSANTSFPTGVSSSPRHRNEPATSTSPRARRSSSSAKPVVLILGGYGFVGRYAAAALRDESVQVLIGTRGGRQLTTSVASEESNDFFQRCLKFHHCLSISDWQPLLHDVDLVINCVGILRERTDETFAAVHHKAVAALAQSCEIMNIPLIHVSALGIDTPVRSEFSLSKLRGEQAIRDSGCHATIVRASVVDADDGYGSGWFRRVAQWPVILLPGNATCLLSPVAAGDLGDALAKLALGVLNAPCVEPECCLLEVSAGENFTLKNYLLRLRKPTGFWGVKPLFVVRVPDFLASLSAKVFDYFSITPYSTGHHELLQFDNVPANNALPEILGRAPAPIGEKLGTIPTCLSVETAQGEFL